MPTSISAADARALAIRAQSLCRRPHRDTARLVTELGAIQIDTISVLARSHELVAFARLGDVTREDIARGLWRRGRTFEYWAHAASVLPIDLWPLFAWRRRKLRARYAEQTGADRAILQRLHAEGPLDIGRLGGARTSPGWWEWSPVKSAVERLLARGDVVCTERRGFRRVYALAEQAIPAPILAQDPDDDACFVMLTRLAGARLGVATLDDLADYFRMPVARVRAASADAGLVPVSVTGWSRPAWADPAALEGPRRAPHRPVLLSPFDSLVWHRPRTERLFGFRHRIEAYTPQHLREHGYFVMPLLAGGGLRGRVDPKRDGQTLVARQISVEPGAEHDMASALVRAARWVGCDNVVLGAISPAESEVPLHAALAALL